MFKHNLPFIYIIILFQITILSLCASSYDYSTILSSKENKISLTFSFDTPISSLVPFQSQNPFDNLFYSYYQTELPLHNGARMHCFIPSPIPLQIQTVSNNNNNISNSTLIQNISLDYGYAYLQQLNNQCYSVYIDKWMYTLCPSKMVIQTLRMLKEDPKTHKLTKEINYIGYGRNFTNISNKYDLYFNSTGRDDNSNSNWKNNKQTNAEFVIDDCVLKIYNVHKLKNKFSIDDQFKIVIEIIYEIQQFKTEPNYNKIRISKFVPDISSYERASFNKKYVTVIREVKQIISDSMFYLDYNLPLNAKYESISIKNTPKDKSKYSKYKTQTTKNKNKLYVYNDLIYCSFCDFSLCTNSSNIKQCFVTDFLNKETRIIITSYANSFARMAYSFSNSGALNQNNFIFWNNDVINAIDSLVYGKGRIVIEGNTIIGSKSNFKEITKHYSNIVNYYIMIISNETLSEYVKCGIKDILTDNLIIVDNECEGRIKDFHYENEVYFLYREYTLKENTFCYKEHNVNYTKLTPNIKGNVDEKYNINLINSIIVTNINAYSDLNERGNVTFPLITENKEAHFSFNLTLLASSSISRSSLHLYATQHETITPFDYEIIIDAKKGIVIKQINNQTALSFYYTEKTTFLDHSLTSSQIDIVFTNGYIYISSSDSSLYKSFKIKHFIDEQRTINYVHIDKAKTSSVQLRNIKVYTNIQLEEKVDLMMFDKKYFLTENATFVDVFVNGDYCEVIKGNRTVTAYYSCDNSGENDLVIVDVKEDKLCEYVVYAESRFLCNPDVLMKKPIRQSHTNVNCVNINEKYNHNIEEFFKREG